MVHSPFRDLFKRSYFFLQVEWSRARYEEICEELRPFLTQSGFQPSKTKFVPVGAVQGINLVGRDKDLAAQLSEWYNGPTLVDLLGTTIRDVTLPFKHSYTISRCVGASCSRYNLSIAGPDIQCFQEAKSRCFCIRKTLWRRCSGWRTVESPARRRDGHRQRSYLVLCIS